MLLCTQKRSSALMSAFLTKDRRPVYAGITGFIVCAVVAACGGGGNQPLQAGGGNQQSSAVALSCDDGMKTALTIGDTTVLAVKQFKQG
ncbi:hypothetical protein, partial [Noviherbaspirillum denitrificans]|uniref:hypothetical protein n=1 Tax=Noviherbaspirillum denitrificans TaxID=1968433 RepID=UPI0019811AE4